MDKPRSPLLTFQFLASSLVGSLVMALVSVFAPPPAQVAVLGAFVSIMGGLFLAYMGQEAERERRRAEQIDRLSVPLTLAPDHELFEQYLAVCQALTELAAQSDPILKEFAGLKLASLAEQIRGLAGGEIEFAGTETWRTVYDKLLRSADLREYRSVAWVRAAGYWQDQPGRQSMAANFEAAHRGVLVERVIVLRDDLWPPTDPLPTDAIRPWIEEQHNHGLWVALVRESDLAAEPGVLSDFGLYGGRAVGVQELDERARTVRFTLSFDRQAVRLARDRWDRLYLFATPYRTLLDRATTG
ncbi:MAG: hypothetical protein U0871_19735 [Gemmataceae bacterium]